MHRINFLVSGEPQTERQMAINTLLEAGFPAQSAEQRPLDSSRLDIFFTDCSRNSISNLQLEIMRLQKFSPIVSYGTKDNSEIATQSIYYGAVTYLNLRSPLKILTDRIAEIIAHWGAVERSWNHVLRGRRLVASLTKREREVLAEVRRGQLNKQIAFRLGISDRTVEIHRANMMNKLGARNLVDVIELCNAADTDLQLLYALGIPRHCQLDRSSVPIKYHS